MLTMTTDLLSPATEDDLNRWLTAAKSGDVLEYHRGFLALDRLAVGGDAARATAERIDRVGTLALTLAESGRAHLIQRRHDRGIYSYLLVARRQDLPRGQTP